MQDIKPKKFKNKKLIMASFLAIFFVAIMLVVGILMLGKKPIKIDEWLSLGEHYLLEMDYDEAIVVFLKVLEVEPMNIPARLGLANAYMGLEDYAKAEEHLLEVLQIQEDNLDAYRLLQELYDASGEWEQLGKLIEVMRRLNFNEAVLYAQIWGQVFRLTAGETEESLEGVRVTLTQSGHAERQSETDVQGNYVLYAREGSYRLEYAKADHIPFEQDIEVQKGKDQRLPRLVLMPNSKLPGHISGRIMDRYSDLALSRVVVAAINEDGEIVATTESDDEGYYRFELATGYYLLNTELEDYKPEELRVFAFTEVELMDVDISLAPLLQAKEVWLTLSWGDVHLDLDAHLVGSAQNKQSFQLNWRMPVITEEGGLKADLSTDAKSKNGVEAMRLLDESDDRYSYYVHDYTNLFNQESQALGQSQATVKSLDSEGIVQTFSVPLDLKGDVWHVCEISQGKVTKASSPLHKIPYIPNIPTSLQDSDPQESSGETRSTNLSMNRKLSNADIDRMDILGNRTAYDVVIECGPPYGWDEIYSKEEYLALLREDAEYLAFGAQGAQPYNFWHGTRFSLAEFRPSDRKILAVHYGDFWGHDYVPVKIQFPFDLELGMPLNDTAKRLGLDYRTIGLLRCQSALQARQFCQTNGIKVLDNYDFWIPESYFGIEGPSLSHSKQMLVDLGQGVICFEKLDWMGEDYEFMALIVNNRDYQVIISLDRSKKDIPIESLSITDRASH